MTVRVPRTTVEHVAELAPKLRQADRDEILALAGYDPEHVLWQSYYHSDMCWSILIDDEVVGIFGCGDCCPWMLGSERLPEAGKAIAVRGRRYIDFMLRRTGFLWNYVHADNTESLRWLKWCGFEIMPPQPIGIHGELFHPFFMASVKHSIDAGRSPCATA